MTKYVILSIGLLLCGCHGTKTVQTESVASEEHETTEQVQTKTSVVYAVSNDMTVEIDSPKVTICRLDETGSPVQTSVMTAGRVKVAASSAVMADSHRDESCDRYFSDKASGSVKEMSETETSAVYKPPDTWWLAALAAAVIILCISRKNHR